MTQRRIVHLDLDTFFVAVERLKDPSLIGLPVIVGHDSSRGVVGSCSYEARRFNIHSGMSIVMAKKLCNHAVIRNGDYDEYAKYSNIVTQIIEEKSPLVEKASIDEHYIDMTGMDLLVKSTFTWSQELQKKVMKETGLPISFGLSVNKTVAKVATGQGKPVGNQYVIEGLEKEFLSPLLVKKIPGVGEKGFKKLSDMGVSLIKTLQSVPIERMASVFGENGKDIWYKGQGIDDSPVTRYEEQKSMSKESTFNEDTIDLPFLEATIISMVFKLCYELRKDKKITGCVALKIKYSDHETKMHQATIPYTSNDKVISDKLIKLFRANHRRQLMRLIGIKFTKLINGNMQIDLLDDTCEQISYYTAMDKIRNRFGNNAIVMAVNAEKKERVKRRR